METFKEFIIGFVESGDISNFSQTVYNYIHYVFWYVDEENPVCDKDSSNAKMQKAIKEIYEYILSTN